MTHEESRHRDDEPRRSDDSRRDSSGPITITTTDPVIDEVVEHRSDWKAHPDTTLQVETTQVGEPAPLYVSGVRTVVIDDEPRQPSRRPNERSHGQKNGRNPTKDTEESRSHKDDREDNRQSPQTQPSMMKNLMITAAVGLVCGVVGAMAYSYFFGSKGENGPSPDKNESAKSKQASSAKKSGGGGSSKDSSKSSNAQASTSDSIPGFSGSNDPGTLEKQINDLMQRVDRMGERVDRISRPKDETPPVLRTMQIKMGELAREIDEVAQLPARVRHYDNQLQTLREDLKSLRDRIESMGGASAGTGPKGASTSGLTLPSPSASSGPMSEIELGPTDPTMALGIDLLQRGQQATAREVFLRLQVARPDDARVWYFSALSEGLTSGNWDGEAKRLAEKGLECERAGHPSTATIDAALATRTPIKGEDWIASLRRRVLSASNAGTGH